MAMRLAEIVTELLQSVLQHPAKGLVDESNAPFDFWVQAVYTELLHASSRSHAQRGKEEKRPPHGLVKIFCLPYEGKVQERYDRRLDTVLCTETLLGASSWVDSMYVWFPAAWMPLVVDAIRAKNVWWDRLGSQQGAVAFADLQAAPLPETRDLKYKYKQCPMDEEGLSPILDVRANVDWLTLDTRTFYHFFPRLYEGILNDVFTQKASMGWHPASPAHVVVSLLLPGWGCWHLLTISLILSMLTQHHGNGFAGKRRAWLRYGAPSTGYIGERRRLMCGMTQCWGSSEVLAMQRALNSARLLRKGLLGCQTAAGQRWYCLLFCMETLAFGSDAIFGNLEGRCFG